MKTITLMAYRRTLHPDKLCPDGVTRSFFTYRIAFRNGKGKIYHASILYWYKRDTHSVSCCSCPAWDYKRVCYHRQAIMADKKLQALVQGDEQ